MEADKVSYTFGMKIQGARPYESANFSVSLTSEVKAGETKEKAMKRVISFVEDEAERKLTELRKAFNDD